MAVNTDKKGKAESIDDLLNERRDLTKQLKENCIEIERLKDLQSQEKN